MSEQAERSRVTKLWRKYIEVANGRFTHEDRCEVLTDAYVSNIDIVMVVYNKCMERDVAWPSTFAHFSELIKSWKSSINERLQDDRYREGTFKLRYPGLSRMVVDRENPMTTRERRAAGEAEALKELEAEADLPQTNPLI